MTIDSAYQLELYNEGNDREYTFEFESIGATTFVLWVDYVFGGVAYRDSPGTFAYEIEFEGRGPIYKRGKITLTDDFFTALAGAEITRLTMQRKTPIYKDITFEKNGEWNSEAFEFEIDKLCMIQQEIEGHFCDCRFTPGVIGEPECVEWVYADGTTLPWSSTLLSLIPDPPYSYSDPKSFVVKDGSGQLFVSVDDDKAYVKSVDGGSTWERITIEDPGAAVPSNYRMIGMQVIDGVAYGVYGLGGAGIGNYPSGIINLSTGDNVLSMVFSSITPANTGIGAYAKSKGAMILGSMSLFGYSTPAQELGLSVGGDFLVAFGPPVNSSADPVKTAAMAQGRFLYKLQDQGWFVVNWSPGYAYPDIDWQYGTKDLAHGSGTEWGQYPAEFDGDPETQVWTPSNNDDINWTMESGAGGYFYNLAIPDAGFVDTDSLGIHTFNMSGQYGRIYGKNSDGAYTTIYLNFSQEIDGNSVPGFHSWVIRKSSSGYWYLIVRNFSNRLTVSRSPNGVPGTFSGRFTVNAPYVVSSARQVAVEERDGKLVFFAGYGSQIQVFEVADQYACVTESENPEEYGNPYYFANEAGVFTELRLSDITTTQVRVTVTTTAESGFILMGLGGPTYKDGDVPDVIAESGPILVTGAGEYDYLFTGLPSGAYFNALAVAVDSGLGNALGAIASDPTTLS